MLNISIARRVDTQPYELTKEEAAIIDQLRKFKTPAEKEAVTKMLQLLCEARDIAPPRR